jgi:hypothetical protein
MSVSARLKFCTVTGIGALPGAPCAIAALGASSMSTTLDARVIDRNVVIGFFRSYGFVMVSLMHSLNALRAGNFHGASIISVRG